MTHQVAAHTDQVWEADLKLLSSRMIGQWSLVLIITFLVMSLILGIALVVNDGWHAVAGVLPVLAAIVAGLWLLGLLIMAVVFRGRYSVRYTINGEGIRMETLSGVAKAANRGLILLGLISGKPGPVGTGLIGMSQETQSVKWRGAFRAITDPAHHGISLRGAWRTLMWVQCTAENYAEVTARITTETSELKPARTPAPVASLQQRHYVAISCARVWWYWPACRSSH